MASNNDHADDTKAPCPRLLSPFKIGPDLELPNRVIMAPMTRGRADPKTLTATDLMAEYYEQRASAGLIITEGVHTSVIGRGWHRVPELYTKRHAESWRAVTDRVHAAGGRIFCQLEHCGRHSHSSFRDGESGYEGDMKKGVAPSPIPRSSGSNKQHYTNLPEGTADIEVPRALTTQEVESIPDEYRNCAQLAKEAGFDGVEIHSSNGFLLDTFLQSSTNKRTDDYGGSKENRFRLIEKVLVACCDVFPSHRVGIRLSPNGAYNSMGSVDNHDAFLFYAQRIAEMNIGYLHLTNGIGPPHKEGPTLELDEIRAIYPGTIIVNSDYDAESAERVIVSGNADAVSFGRLFISNPDLPDRFATKGAELNDMAERPWWSTFENQLGSKGYTDYTRLAEPNV
eukprot:CAMPEP_0113532088 /NCGR_PEP_ID=MMETSP0015_2-20120614/3854_1 /TAXON_ID=2838 /ORGANISM="Odontella" /LENGTH=396 /DNA_ID=CAMNT_0000430989 /DNA_START=165 /DNA_END=1355 /DNA_ORIENTATION=+ /assembly_acc=CAM_ASM_000160